MGAALPRFIQVAFPMQFTAQLTHRRLLLQTNEGSQGCVDHLSFGADTGQLLGALDEVIVEDNIGAHFTPFLFNE
jgi:hypothetical protein